MTNQFDEIEQKLAERLKCILNFAEDYKREEESVIEFIQACKEKLISEGSGEGAE